MRAARSGLRQYSFNRQPKAYAHFAHRVRLRLTVKQIKPGCYNVRLIEDTAPSPDRICLQSFVSLMSRWSSLDFSGSGHGFFGFKDLAAALINHGQLCE